MTREEKVNLLNILLEIEEKNDVGNLTSTDRREFQQWVEDLEQESILDKIRAEIEQVVWEDVFVSLDGTDEIRIPRLKPGDVFKIIDKYRK